MMLPILISVSLAPVSYFFWARALPPVMERAMTAVESVTRRRLYLEITLSSVSSQFADQALGPIGDLPRAVRHKEDDQDQDDAEHGAGQTLGDAFGDVRHEHDEGRAGERAGQPADAADHHAQEQRDGELDGVAIRRHELPGDGAEAAGDAGDARADAECQ